MMADSVYQRELAVLTLAGERLGDSKVKALYLAMQAHFEDRGDFDLSKWPNRIAYANDAPPVDGIAPAWAVTLSDTWGGSPRLVVRIGDKGKYITGRLSKAKYFRERSRMNVYAVAVALEAQVRQALRAAVKEQDEHNKLLEVRRDMYAALRDRYPEHFAMHTAVDVDSLRRADGTYVERFDFHATPEGVTIVLRALSPKELRHALVAVERMGLHEPRKEAK